MQTICVYCASSTQIRSEYFNAARELGVLLAHNDCRIVCGAGSMGLMGEVSNAALQAGGKVIGVIPKFMVDEGWSHNNLSELVVTDNMHERKKRMASLADAVVALPGGCGTLEELLEVITWKQLGLFTKPIIILNIEGYFNPLIEMLHKATDEHFMRSEHLKMWKVVSTPGEVLEAVRHSEQWEEHFRKFAAI